MARSKRLNKDAHLQFEELYRSEVLNYEMVYYDVSTGDPDDPASQTERRVAVFAKGTMPEDLGKAYADSLNGSGSRYYSYFDGIPGHLVDQVVEVTKEHDYQAEQYREEERRLREKPTRYNSRTYEYEETGEISDFEKFWQAVERYAEDDTDEEAWAVIQSWRNRQLRQEERV